MSEILQDKKVIQDGRTAPLKDVEAPLRDQIVAKLYKQVVEEGIGEKIAGLWTRSSNHIQAWLERQQAYLASWDEHLINDTEGPFKGSSNLHIPMPFIVAKTMHARFLQATFAMDPPFHTKARNEASQARVDTVSDVMRYAIYDWANYNKGIEYTVDRWIWDWITTGVGEMKVRWDCKYTRFIDVESVVTKGAPIIQTDATGKTVAIPRPKVVEREVARTKKVFEGPVVDPVNPEDLRIIGGNGDPDLADVVIHRQYLTASELWTLVDRRIFNEDAVKKIIESGPNLQSTDATGAIKMQRAQNAGKASVDQEQDLDRYEILEAYMPYDVDGSGINADIVVWTHRQSYQVLRATYLHRISKSGERPFIKADFHLRSDQEMGTGLIELLYPLSREMDAIHNMRLDFGLISVMPFGFYRATSGIDPETISLEPGSLIPVDNPQSDVFFPNLGNRTVFGMQEEQAIQGMIERLTSINDMNMNVVSGQGVTRTAAGVRYLAGEGTANLDVYLRRLNRGWKKFLRCLLHMLQQRIPDGLSFRLTGDDGQDYWRTVRASDDIAGDFDIEVSPNSSTSNKTIQQDIAQQIVQITSSPLDIQLGIINQSNRYEALRNFLQSMGVKDYHRYINQPDPNFQFKTLTPEEEANRVLHGLQVPVLPEMDHQGFIDFFNMHHDDDVLLGHLTRDQAVAFAGQAAKHKAMLASLKQMQAQKANAQQMQTNAQQGASMLNPGTTIAQTPLNQPDGPDAPAAANPSSVLG